MKYLLMLVLTALLWSISSNTNAQQTCPQTGNGAGNLITNGDFEGCADGSFSSDFTFTRDCGSAAQVTPGQWGVVAQANQANSFFANVTDHTGGGGNMMVIDVDQPDANAYCTTVNVTSNTTYFFSAWIANINTSNASGEEICDWIAPGAYCDNPPILQFTIEGAGIGDTVSLNPGDNGWYEFYASWNSGATSGAIDICLKNLNPYPNGNDLALDDLSFTSNCANVEAAVVFDPLTDLPDVMSTCYEGGQVTLETGLSTNDIFFEWKDQNKDVFGGNQPSQVINSADGEGYYYVCMDPIEGGNPIGCPQADSVLIENSLTVTLPDLTLCDPPTATLSTAIPNGDLFDITWSRDGQIIDGATGTTYEATAVGEYCVTVNGAPGCDATDCGTIDSDLAEPIDATFCPVDSGGNGMVTLGVDGEGDFRWYATDVSTVELGQGDTYLAGPLDEETTFYVQNVEPEQAVLGPAQPSNCSENYWLNGDQAHALNFDANKDFTLHSIVAELGEPGSVCWDAGASYPVNMTITGPGGFNESLTPMVACSGGNANVPRTLNIELDIPQGDGYTISLNGNEFQLNRCLNGTYPQTDAAGVATITGNNATGNDAGKIAALYDWDVSYASDCGRIPVTATIDCPPCTDPEAEITPDGPTTFCEGDDVTLEATQNPGNLYTWFRDGEIINGAGMVEDDWTITVTQAGNYAVQIDTAACSTLSEEIEVIVNPLLTPLISIRALSATEICEGDEVSLTITDTAFGGPTPTFAWAVNATPSNLGPTFTSTTLNDGDIVYVAMQTSITCFTQDTAMAQIPITVWPIPEPTLADAAICSVDEEILDPGDFETYTWSTGDDTETLTVNTADTYSVTVANEGGCEATAEMTLTVDPSPTVQIVADQTICIGEDALLTVELEGTGPFDVTYQDGTGNVQLNGIDDGESILVSPLITTDYTPISVTDAICPGDTLGGATVTVNPLPTGAINGDNTICLGESADITFVFTGNGPFTAFLEVNGTPEQQTNLENGDVWTVTPSETTTYRLVSVEDNNGCSATPTPDDAIVVVELLPGAEIVGTTTLCEGENTDITFNLDGDGPFDVVYTDGTDEFTLDDVNDGHTINVAPTATTTYTLVSVNSDAGDGCAGPVTGEAVITINELPTAELTADIAICQGEDTDLSLVLAGAEPMDLTYEDGVAANPFNLNAATNGQLLNVAPNTTTTYTLLTVEDANGCVGSVEGNPVTVTVNEAPTFANQMENCVAGGPPFFFTVSFDIEGGDPGSYAVTPATGTITNGTFTSDQVDNLTNYSFSVDDGNGCGPVLVEGTKDCSCVTDAGTMDNTALTLCDGVTASTTWNLDTLMEQGDVFMYILHTNSGTNEGTILNQGANPDFDFIPGTMEFGTTYYISAVLGPDGGDGTPDLADGCTRVAPGTPVEWIELPTAEITGTTEICLGLDTDLEFTLTGNGPFTVVYSDGTDDFTLNTINTGHNETVAPTATTTYNIVSVSDGTTPTACEGTAVGDDAEISIVLPPNPTVPSYTCAADKATFVVDFEVEDAVVGTYEINDPGTLTGNAFESDPIVNLLPTPYSFTVTSLNSCPDALVEGEGTCECETEAGTLSGAPLILCEDEVAVTTHNGDEFLENDDDIMFILKTGFGAAIGNIVATNNTAPVFSYIPAINFGQTYFIAAVAGNSDGSGGVDLSDPCISVSPPIAVVWNEIPHAEISGDATVCVGSSTYLEFELTGSPPFDVVYTDGNAKFSLNGIESGYLQQVTPTETVTYSVVSVADAGIAECEGTVGGTATITVPAALILSEVSPAVSCNGDCNGVALVNILTDNADPANFDYQWFDGDGVPIAGATDQALPGVCPGAYIVEVTDQAAGCTASIGATIDEPEIITVSLVEAIDPSCAGFSDGSLTIMAEGGTIDNIERYTYSWNGAAAIDDSTANALAAGDHTIEVFDANDCSVEVTYPLTDPDAVVVTATTANRRICPGGTAMLEASATGGNGPYTYSWTDDAEATMSDPTIATPTVSPSIASTYPVIAFDSNNCPSTQDTVNVQIYDEVVITAGMIPPVICAGETSRLFHGATNGNANSYTFTWTDQAGTFTALDTVDVMPTETTPYTVSVEDACGSTDEATVTVTVNPTPEPMLLATHEPQCNSDIVTFVNDHTNNVASTCVLDFGDGTQATDCDGATHTYNEESKYNITMTMTSDDAAGCSASSSLTETTVFAPKPIADFTPSPKEASMFFSEVNFSDASTGAITYAYDFGDGFSDTIANPLHVYDFTQPGVYPIELTVTNQFGCIDTHLDTVTLTGEYSIFVPSAFTPNADGDNEFFYPVTLGLNSLELLIYDRWGDMIYNGNDLNAFWDGTVKETGETAKSDVYTWQIFATSLWSEDDIFKTGRVTLIR